MLGGETSLNKLGRTWGEGGASGETTKGPILNFDQTWVKHDHIKTEPNLNFDPS